MPMEWLASTTCSLAPARRSSRVTKTKSVKSHSTHRATRSSLRAATRHAGFGLQRLVMRFSAWGRTRARDTRMKFSLARSTMRATRSLQVLKITPAASGRIRDSLEPGRKKMPERPLQPRLLPWEGKCRLQHKRNRNRIESSNATSVDPLEISIYVLNAQSLFL